MSALRPMRSAGKRVVVRCSISSAVLSFWNGGELLMPCGADMSTLCHDNEKMMLVFWDSINVDLMFN